jgi:hypothetical protein
MLVIENIDKIVGTKLVLHNFYIPSPMLEWVCERVEQFPTDDVWIKQLGSEEAYRFEYKANSEYDVPLCIYLRRNADETGRYKMENNLMDVDNWVLGSAIQNQKLFQNVLMVYANEVIVKWAKDQNML